MKLENLKTLKLDLSKAENINNLYFQENEDGSYTPTATLIHNILRDSLNYYKDLIFQLDTECKYHTEKLAEFKDTWKEKQINDQRELKYGEQLKELEKRKRKWREENPDKCDTRSGGPNLGDKDEMRFFAGYSPDIKPTLNQAVSLYKYLKEFDNDNGDTIKEEIPQKPEVLLVKSDFKQEYKELCDKWMEELGIPMETEEIGTVTRTKYTINQLRNANMKQVVSSDKGLDDYIDGLINFITSSNKDIYKQKRDEVITLIDKDFIINFNDSVKNLKAEDGPHDSIEIYTKLTDDETPLKLITIGKEDANDEFHKFVMNVDADGEYLRYNRNIKTKADLRTALEMSMMIVEGTHFDKYKEDLQQFIDTIL